MKRKEGKHSIITQERANCCNSFTKSTQNISKTTREEKIKKVSKS